MATIYYPHLDLENKWLLQYPPDHILNIKLLTLLADDVLILSSHLLDADINQLHAIKDGLYAFIIDGKVKTVLYKGYGTLEEYLHHKTESLLDQTLRLSYQGKADYINARIFDHNSHLLSVNNEQEREQFHNIYVDTNLNKARQIGNRWLIHSALEFRDEVYKRRDQKATYLTLPEINQAIFDLMKAGRIKEPHYSFFLKN